jgi:hypothetical protein
MDREQNQGCDSRRISGSDSNDKSLPPSAAGSGLKSLVTGIVSEFTKIGTLKLISQLQCAAELGAALSGELQTPPGVCDQLVQ